MPYKDRSKMYENQSKHRDRNFQRLWDFLADATCMDCSESDSIVLEFDHRPDQKKSFDIARAVAGSTRSWGAIHNEILKCDVVCANCHRKRTAQRGNWNRYRATNKETDSTPRVVGSSPTERAN